LEKELIKELVHIIENIPLKKLMEQAKTSNMILDAGAGDLQHTTFLKNMGYSVIPVDILMPKDNNDTTFIQASIENLPFEDNMFDLVYSFSVLEFVEYDQKAVGELYRVLKKGSFCIITVPSSISVFRLLIDLENLLKINSYTNKQRAQHPEYDQKVHCYTNTQIKTLLNKFTLIELCGYDLNFVPRLASFFYKIITRREISIKSNSLIKIGSDRIYKNRFLSEICYHKILVCKK
jgi:ubiquinone/menaquinone biosynthesis C-methylase UbiE